MSKNFLIGWPARSAGMTLATICALGASGPAPNPAHATAGPAAKCGRAVVAAKARLARADTRAINRCALALLEPRRGRQPQKECRALRTPGIGVDRADAGARERISRSCVKELPGWWPLACAGTDPAHCSVRAVHCASIRAAESTFEGIRQLLDQQDPRNLHFQFGGIAGNTFYDCFEADPATTTTTTSTSSTTSSTLATTTSTLPEPSTPRLVITEIMNDPAASSDSTGEYFEVFNPGTAAIDLEGAVVSDTGSNSFTVSSSLTVPAGGWATFGRSASAGDGRIDYVYGSSMSLANSADQIIIELDGVELDRVEYDTGFPTTAGKSMQLDSALLDEIANDDAQSWCSSDMVLSDGDSGTPGTVNDSCSR